MVQNDFSLLDTNEVSVQRCNLQENPDNTLFMFNNNCTLWWMKTKWKKTSFVKQEFFTPFVMQSKSGTYCFRYICHLVCHKGQAFTPVRYCGILSYHLNGSVFSCRSRQLYWLSLLWQFTFVTLGLCPTACKQLFVAMARIGK